MPITNKMQEGLQIFIGNIPSSVGQSKIEEILRAYGIDHFLVKKSKNKGQAKACHAIVTLKQTSDYKTLIRRGQFPIIMYQGRLSCLHPGEVEVYETDLIRQNRIESSIQEISKCHPYYHGYYLRYLSIQRYKGKGERILQVHERFIRRVYINGYFPSDIGSSINQDMWLNETKLKLMRHFSQFDEVVNIFAKVKTHKVNIYVDFLSRDTPLLLIGEECLYKDDKIEGYQTQMHFDGRIITLVRSAKEVLSMKPSEKVRRDSNRPKRALDLHDRFSKRKIIEKTISSCLDNLGTLKKHSSSNLISNYKNLYSLVTKKAPWRQEEIQTTGNKLNRATFNAYFSYDQEAPLNQPQRRDTSTQTCDFKLIRCHSLLSELTPTPKESWTAFQKKSLRQQGSFFTNDPLESSSPSKKPSSLLMKASASSTTLQRGFNSWERPYWNESFSELNLESGKPFPQRINNMKSETLLQSQGSPNQQQQKNSSSFASESNFRIAKYPSFPEIPYKKSILYNHYHNHHELEFEYGTVHQVTVTRPNHSFSKSQPVQNKQFGNYKRFSSYHRFSSKDVNSGHQRRLLKSRLATPRGYKQIIWKSGCFRVGFGDSTHHWSNLRFNFCPKN